MIPPPSSFNSGDWQRIARLLFDLGGAIREGIRLDRSRNPQSIAHKIHKTTSADTIYEIDRVSEESLVDWFRKNWPAEYPALVIAEGLGDESGVRFPEDISEPQLLILIDPIDGTRGLMYDKRSAWMLAGAAAIPPGGGLPTLADLRAGAMVEIPTSRQSISDGARGWRADDGSFQMGSVRSPGPGKATEPLALRPSTAADLRHGFACFANFFPEGRGVIQRIESSFLRNHLPEIPSKTPLVFNDQYISSGGQLFELLAGRDRMIADIRPLVFEKLGFNTSLTCHPYDLACLPVIHASSCVIEDPWGTPLNAPLDTLTPVAWVGYANQTLANTLRPLLRETLLELGFTPPSDNF